MEPSNATDILADRVRDLLGNRPITAKRMFGGLTFLLSGNMLCCVSAKGLMARIGAAAEPAALAKPYAAPCLGSGRRMAGFILVEPPGGCFRRRPQSLARPGACLRRTASAEEGQVAAPPPTAVA